MADTSPPVAAPVTPAPRQRDDETGQFASGNAIARTHGLYAQRIADELAAEREAFEAQSITEDGGEDEITARRRSLHEYRSRLHIHIVQLSGAIETFGLFDRRGRLRAQWLQRLEGLIARAASIDSTLGLDRRTKQIPSLAEFLAQKEQGK